METKLEILGSIDSPTRLDFLQNYYRKNKPILIHHLIDNWSASEKWNIQYLYSKIGHKSIIVECGKLLSNNFNRKKIIAAHFFQNLKENSDSEQKCYLAQQRLDQFPELLDDIGKLKLYSSESQTYNMLWVGPKGTVTPLHYDRGDNFLVQIMGKKQVIMYPPYDSLLLYPRNNDKSYSNFSNVDIELPDLDKFPLFRKAKAVQCELYKNDTLYIPKGWWHFVKSEEISISVNFFWRATHVY